MLRVVRILRSPKKIRSQGRRVVPSAAVHKPPGKWTVVAAFVLAVMLHAGAVMWVEIQQEKPPSEANAPSHPFHGGLRNGHRDRYS